MNDLQAKDRALKSARKMCSEIVRLQGLTGTGGIVTALTCHTTADVILALNNGYAATAAGDFGGFNVWKVGILYYAEYYKYGSVHDRLISNLMPLVRNWVNRHFIMMGGDIETLDVMI